MIVDTINNITKYYSLSEDLKDALQLLTNYDSNSETCDFWYNDKIRIIINEYETSAVNNGSYEVHSNTIDIQYPLVGEEMVQWHNSFDVKMISDYDIIYDRTYFSVCTKPIDIIIGNMQFAIFFAGELHNPGLSSKLPIFIKKLTIKIKS